MMITEFNCGELGHGLVDTINVRNYREFVILDDAAVDFVNTVKAG